MTAAGPAVVDPPVTEGAPDVLAELGRLPHGQRFATLQEVWQSLGGHRD